LLIATMSFGCTMFRLQSRNGLDSPPSASADYSQRPSTHEHGERDERRDARAR